jgi:hypothetical protein
MGGWHPTIGDPGFLGWFTTGSYFACAIVASIVARINQKTNRRFFFFWSVICLLMILLGINKQLDLQTLFAEVGRQVANAQGWYYQRRTVQFWFIVAFGTAVLVTFLSFVIIMRDLFRRFMFALTGLFFLLSFVIIRAASFHHFDEILGFRFFGTRVHRLLELIGIFSILIAGLKEIIPFRKINTR